MKNTYDKADYRAIRNSAIPAAVMQSGGARFDSAEEVSAFFARELDYVKGRSYDKLYPQFTAMNLFPISTDADPGAETVTYYTYDREGFAKIIDNYADDLPRADVNGKPNIAQVKSLGASYGYSAQEIRASRMAGKNLDARKAESARYQIDNLNNKIAWNGDTASGLLGVLSAGQNVPTYTIGAGATSGKTKWTEKTADEILADINGMAAQVSRVTKDVERPDTLCVPNDVFMDLSTRQLPNTAVTVKKFILDNAPYLKDIVSTPELNPDSPETNPYAEGAPGVATNAGVGVAFLFTNSADKMVIENPMPFMQYPVQPHNLETVIPCEARTAGVIFFYPLSALIAAGVS